MTQFEDTRQGDEECILIAVVAGVSLRQNRKVM